MSSPEEIAGSIPFRELSATLSQMRHQGTGNAKSALFYRFLTKQGGESGKPGVIGDLLRSADNEDLNNFRTGTTSLARKIEKALELDRNDLQMRDPHKVYNTLRQLVHPVMERHTAAEQSLTVTQVYSRMTELMTKSGEAEKDGLRELFDNCDATELLWIFAIMTKSVVIALDWNSAALREMLTPGAKDAYKVNRDMKRADVRAESSFPLMCNFEPMLLARLDMDDWYGKIKKYAGEQFFMELKFDGEHVVIHKRGSHWRIVTRNGKDFTKYYDGSDGRKNVIDAIKGYFRSDVEDCVIDCELMLFDEIANKFVRHHQETADGQTHNFQNIREGQSVHLAVVVLDILLLNEHNFMGTSCEKRVRALETLLLKKQNPNLIFVPQRKVGNTSDDVELFFNGAMAAGEEGVVIKRRDTKYYPGRRWNKNGWFKVKANLTEGAHLDVAVVGVSYDGPQREQKFVIAVRKTFGASEEEDEEEEEFDLQVVGAIGAGLTHKERQWIIEEGTRMGKLVPNPTLAGLKGREIKNGGYFEDWDDMKVVEIRCAGKQGFALQHASIVRIRLDKDLKTIDTLRDYSAMEERIKRGGLPALDQKAKDAKEEAARKRKGTQPAPSKAKLMRETVCPSTSRGALSWKLSKYSISVIPGRSEKRAKEIADILAGFGAQVKVVPDEATDFLVAETPNATQTKKRIKENKYTIIDGKWAERCKTECCLSRWTQDEIVHDALDDMYLRFD